MRRELHLDAGPWELDLPSVNPGDTKDDSRRLNASTGTVLNIILIHDLLLHIEPLVKSIVNPI